MDRAKKLFKDLTFKSSKEILKDVELEMNQKDVILPDFHVPYHDKNAIDLTLKYIKKNKPDRIVQIGDFQDFYSVSKFDKDPKRIDTLQDELDIGYDIWKDIKKSSKKSKLVYLEGNHEFRLRKYLWRHPELHSLEILKLENVLKTKELGIKFYRNVDTFYLKPNLIATHGAKDDGCKLSQHSGYSAKNTLEKVGINGISGHCFDKDTELLTQEGWKNGLELKETDIVGTMNKKTLKFQWNKINEIFVYENYNKLYKIKGHSTDLLVTDKHGLIIEKENGKIVELTAKEMINYKGKIGFLNAIPSQEIINVDRELDLRLIVNIVADGCFEGNAIRWHLKKDRKIKHLKELLTTHKFEFTESKIGETTKIYLKTKSAKPIIQKLKEKILPNFFKDLTRKEAEIVLNEYSITDGNKNSSAKNSYQISSKKEKEIDILQEMFMKNGFRTSKIKRPYKMFLLTVNTRYKNILTKRNIQKVSYKGKVWCVNVDNGTLMVRRNGKTTITLNTHRLASHYKRMFDKQLEWHEAGCLCDLDPDYVKKPNWQQGFAIVNYDKKKFNVETIPIKDGYWCIAEGKLYQI